MEIIIFHFRQEHHQTRAPFTLPDTEFHLLGRHRTRFGSTSAKSCIMKILLSWNPLTEFVCYATSRHSHRVKSAFFYRNPASDLTLIFMVITSQTRPSRRLLIKNSMLFPPRWRILHQLAVVQHLPTQQLLQWKSCTS